jgi:hypothetical protein
MLPGSLSSAASPRVPFGVGARGPWSEIYDVALPPSKDLYKTPAQIGSCHPTYM